MVSFPAPSVVKPVSPPNEPPLLYWICPLVPPGDVLPPEKVQPVPEQLTPEPENVNAPAEPLILSTPPAETEIGAVDTQKPGSTLEPSVEGAQFACPEASKLGVPGTPQSAKSVIVPLTHCTTTGVPSTPIAAITGGVELVMLMG